MDWLLSDEGVERLREIMAAAGRYKKGYLLGVGRESAFVVRGRSF